MVELIIALVNEVTRLWLQSIHSPGRIFMCRPLMVPLILADHLDSTCHRPQSRTTRETAWFWVCPSPLLEKYLEITSFVLTSIPSSLRYIFHAGVSQSFSHLAHPCPWSLAYAVLIAWNAFSLHLATSKSSVRSEFKGHFLRQTFFAPLNYYSFTVCSLGMLYSNIFIFHNTYHNVKYLDN